MIKTDQLILKSKNFAKNSRFIKLKKIEKN